MRFLIAAVFATLLSALVASQTYAHVLITDSTHGKGAVLHINPDDDPIAGEESSFLLNTQDFGVSEGKIQLFITNIATNEKRQVVAPIVGTMAKLDYTFPTRGVYNLEFAVQGASTQYIFSYDLRVDRGLNLNSAQDVYYQWADILVISSTIGIVVILIVAFNRRRDIAKQSMF